MLRTLLVLMILGVTACSGNDGDAAHPAAAARGGHAGGYVECVVPRPEMCTKEYRPVCGLRDTGIRCVTEPCDSWETKTYSNACTACSDGSVYGWRPGACEEEGVVRDE